MGYSINDLIEISDSNHDYCGQLGFVSAKSDLSSVVEITLLNKEGLIDIIDIRPEKLSLSKNPLAQAYFGSYQNTVNEIAKEAEDRQKKWRLVTNHLARKYNISPDEVCGIYKTLLSYEEFFEENLLRQ